MSRNLSTLAPTRGADDVERRVAALEAAVGALGAANREMLRLLERAEGRRGESGAQRRVGVPAAARILGVSRDSVRRMIAQGRLRAWTVRLTGARRATTVVDAGEVAGLLDALPAPTAPRGVRSSGCRGTRPA